MTKIGKNLQVEKNCIPFILIKNISLLFLGLQRGTPTKRQVSKRQVSKRLVSKRPVSKRQVYKTSCLQKVRFQNVFQKFDLLMKQKV
jgi:hypothetical protein